MFPFKEIKSRGVQQQHALENVKVLFCCFAHVTAFTFYFNAFIWKETPSCSGAPAPISLCSLKQIRDRANSPPRSTASNSLAICRCVMGVTSRWLILSKHRSLHPTATFKTTSLSSRSCTVQTHNMCVCITVHVKRMWLTFVYITLGYRLLFETIMVSGLTSDLNSRDINYK